MKRFIWLNWIDSFKSRKNAKKQLRQKGRRAVLERLEDRLAPATFTWTGAGSTSLWSDPNNWQGLVAPNPAGGEDLQFPASAVQFTSQNDLTDAVFNLISFSGSNYDLSGNAITLGTSAANTGFVIANLGTTNNAINFDITMGGAAGNRQFFTVGTQGAILTMNGQLRGNTGVELSKGGEGTLILTADNSQFTGPIAITQGAINVRNGNALGSTSAPTTVQDVNGTRGQLQVQGNITIAEPLFIAGPGLANDGALLNVAGNNVLTGSISLGGTSTLGATAGSMTLQGVIDDLGAGHGIIKEGPAKVILDPLNSAAGNIYRGKTIINDGTLTIRHSLALGNETTPSSDSLNGNDTIVNSFPQRSGTLQVEYVANANRIDPNVNATGDGFGIPYELLTLNGPGVEGIHVYPKQGNVGPTVSGALNNLSGKNTWYQDITLWSDTTTVRYDPLIWNWGTVGIGVETGSELTIAGHVKDDLLTGGTASLPPAGSDYSLIKTRGGRLILITSNTYRGRTEILEGYLNIRDSAALGATGNTRNETIVFPGGTLELEADTIPDSNPAGPSPDGKPHLDTDIVIGTEQVSLMGAGAGNNGSLRNILGTNEITGGIPMRTLVTRGSPVTGNGTFTANGASVGVEPDRAPFAPFDLSQLTLSNVVSQLPTNTPANLTKVGRGELVLTDVANTYTGSTFIVQGWITARNDASLGANINGPDTIQPPTYVAEGAALHFKQTRSLTPVPITVFERLFLSGIGITHRFPELNLRGALLNLSGLNTLTGIVNLTTTTNFNQIGIGADIDSTDGSVTASELALTNLTQEAADNQANTLAGIANFSSAQPAGINKLGRKRVILEGQGTFRGDNRVTEGVLRVRNNTALGMLNGVTTVLTGAAIEMQGYIPNNNGGLPGGIQVRETLILNGMGNVTADDPTHGFTNPTSVSTLTGVADDNIWNGLITFTTDVSVDVKPNSRLGLYKKISGAGGFEKIGLGKLVLGGTNTFDGLSQIKFGTVNLQAPSALGSPTGGTVVSNDAQIELQGDITISGENLTILGNGPNSVPNIPLRWFPQGPGPNNDTSVNGSATTGRISGISVDPRDPNVMYLSAGTGGAWRSKNGGFTWEPLIDDAGIAGIDQILFTGDIKVAPTNSNTIYVALGEAVNSADSFYGKGILRSTNYGRTWTLIQPPGNAFDRRTISRIVVDPVNANTIYVAVYGTGTGTSGNTNFGIWRFDGSAWTNLTAGITPTDDTNVTFSATADRYSDLAVFDASFRGGANNRIITFSIGNPSGAASNAVYISIDAGATWTRSSFNNALEDFTGQSGIQYLQRPRNGNIKIAGTELNNVITLYAAITYPINNPRVDQGTSGTFREIQTVTVTWDGIAWIVGTWGAMGTQPPQNYMGNQGDYNSVIAVQPGNPNYIFVGGIGGSQPGPYVYNGSSWSEVDPGSAGNGPFVNYHAVGWDSTGRLLVGNDGGIWRLNNTTPPTGPGANWENINGNFLQLTQFLGMDVHPFEIFNAVGGANGTGTMSFLDSPYWTLEEDRNGGIVQINKKSPNIIYHLRDNQLRRTLDGGVTWSTIFTSARPTVTWPGPAYTSVPMILDQRNASRLLIVDQDVNLNATLRESLNVGGAATFNTIFTAPTNVGIVKIGLAELQGDWVNDPSFPLAVDNGKDSYDPGTVWILASNGVYLTKNSGNTWQQRNGSGGTALTGGSYADIAVDPRNRDTAYVVRNVFGGTHVFRTTDAGLTWTNISGNLPDLPTWKVLVNPRNGDVYIGNDNGVYVLPGGTGVTWSRYGVGMPNVQVRSMVYNSLTNMLTVGTYGRGMYQLFLDDSRVNGGVIRAVSGSSVWTGDVQLTGDIDLRSEIDAKVTFSGVISDNTSGANWTINKLGSGQVVFAGANTYGGLTDIKEGVLVAQNPTALGASAGKTIVRQNAQLPAALWLQSDLTLETVELNGDGVPFNGHNTGALRSVSNANTFTGTLVFKTSTTIGVDLNSELIIGTKTGLAGAGTISDESNGFGFVKELTGRLTLNTANTYGGLTDVIQGVLRVEHALALGSTAAGTQVRNGAQLEINQDTAGNGITVVGEQLDLSGTGIFNSGAVENISGNNTWKGPVTFRQIAGIPAPPPATPPFKVSMGVVRAVDTLTIDGVISESGGSFAFDKVQPGKVVLKQSNTYSGLTTVVEGTLNAQAAGALGATTAGTVVNNGAALELESTTGIVFDAETVTLNGRGISPGLAGSLRNVDGDNTWTGNVILNSTVLAASATANPRIDLGVETGSTLIISGVVQDATSVPATNKAAELHKIGGDLLSLTGTNTYRGKTFVDVGTLRVNNDAALGVGGTVASDTTVATGATLQVAGGFTETNELLNLNGMGVGGKGALENFSGNNTWASGVTLVTDASMGVTGAGDRLTVSSVIGESVSGRALTKVGTGTLQFSGTQANTYTGLTTVKEGTLELNKTAGINAIAGNLTVGDAIAPPAVVDLLANNQIADSVTVLVQNDGTFNVGDHLETLGVLNVQDGDVTVGTASTGTLTVNDLRMTGGTISIDTVTSSVVLGGNVQATASATETATITGAGSLSLGGANRSFTVTDNISAATDLLVDVPIIGTTSEGLIKAGAGRLELDAANTFTGITQIDAGDVQVDGSVGPVELRGGSVSGLGTVGTITGGSPTSGTINPGDNAATSPTGVLQSGAVNLNAQSTFFVDLVSAANGPGTTGYDQLSVTGDVNLNGAKLTGTIVPAIGVGDTFTIITVTGGTVNGQFASGDRVFIGSKKFLITYNTNSVVLQRVKADVTVSIASSANPSVYGQNVVWTATVTPEAGAQVPPTTTTVTFTLDEGTTPVVTTDDLDGTGKAVFDYFAVTNGVLTIGSHTLKAEFNGDDDYNTATGNLTPNQQVNKANTTIAVQMVPASPNPVFGQSVLIRATVTAVAPGAGVPTGTATFTVDGQVRPGTFTLNSLGQVDISLTGLSIGQHRVRVTYSGDGNFNTFSTTTDFTFTVDKANTTVTVVGNPPSSTFGDLATFVATITAASPGVGTPTGTAFFYDGAVAAANLIGSGSLINGVASFSTSTLVSGSHDIFVVYTGDTNFNVGNGSLSAYIVQKIATVTTVSASVNPSVFGQNVVFTAAVTPTDSAAGIPTGSIIFTVDGVVQPAIPLNAQGKASIPVNYLNAGNRVVKADYSGATNLSSSSGTITQTVAKASTTTTVQSSANPSAVGQSVTFTAFVRPAGAGGGIPSGNVTFRIDGSNVVTVPLNGNGSATYTTSSLTRTNGALGSAHTPHTVQVFYSGATNYATSNSTVLQQKVVRFATTTTLASSASTSVYGQSVVFTATVDGVGTTLPATGSVIFQIDGVNRPAVPLTTVGQFTQARLTINTLIVGAHTVSAYYLGATDFGVSNATQTQTVNKANTGISLLRSASPSVFGQSVNYTVIVAPVAPGGLVPTGTVQITIDGGAPITRTLSNGRVSFVASLTVGNHAIEVAYAGTSSYNVSNATFNQTVNKAATKTTITTNRNPAIQGQAVVFSVVVAPTAPGAGVPAGTVTFVINNVAQTPVTLNAQGRATFVPTNLTTANQGRNSVVAVYSGSGSHVSSRNSFVQVVQGASKILVSSPTGSVGLNKPFTIALQALTSGNLLVPGYNAPVGVRLISAPAGGTLTGGFTSTFVNGRATFSNRTLTRAGRYVLQFISGNLVTNLVLTVEGRLT